MTLTSIIDQLWRQYSNSGKIDSKNAIKLYSKLGNELKVDLTSLNTINEFLSSNPEIVLDKKTDIEYLFERLTGESLKVLYRQSETEKLAEYDESDLEPQDEEDACQVIYSPHKKTPKITPVFENNASNKDISKNLFPQLLQRVKQENDQHDDLTRDIFNDRPAENKPKPEPKQAPLAIIPTNQQSPINELREKKQRILDLERVMLELQNYIQKLNEYNDKEAKNLKRKYEKRIISCELKVQEMSNWVTRLNQRTEDKNPKSGTLFKGITSKFRSVFIRNLRFYSSILISMLVSHYFFILGAILTFVLYIYHDTILAVWIGLVALRVSTIITSLSNYINTSKEPIDSSLDQTLQEFCFLVELVS